MTKRDLVILVLAILLGMVAQIARGQTEAPTIIDITALSEDFAAGYNAGLAACSPPLPSGREMCRLSQANVTLVEQTAWQEGDILWLYTSCGREKLPHPSHPDPEAYMLGDCFLATARIKRGDDFSTDAHVPSTPGCDTYESLPEPGAGVSLLAGSMLLSILGRRARG